MKINISFKEFKNNHSKKKHQILDGQSFEEATKTNNLKINKINKVNAKKEDQSKNKINSLPNDLFNKIYNIKSTNVPEIINLTE